MTPDWIMDSVENEERMEEERYHPSSFKGEPENQISHSLNGRVPLELRSDESVAGGGQESSTLSITGKTKEGNKSPGKDLAVEDVTKEKEEVSVSVRDELCEGKLSPKEKEQESENNPSLPVTGSELLLDRVVICFTDYQDCVEDDTLDKWKLVSLREDDLYQLCFGPHRFYLPMSVHIRW